MNLQAPYGQQDAGLLWPAGFLIELTCFVFMFAFFVGVLFYFWTRGTERSYLNTPPDPTDPPPGNSGSPLGTVRTNN